VQKLLKETGKSFTEHIARCRLERAFAMLTDPRHLHLAIIDIAFAVGFGEFSHFNRMFHKRFGETPSGFAPHRSCASREILRLLTLRGMNAGICGLREHPSAT
jgi:transcriptional regulator GlxA family with amidase domain